MSSLSSAFVDMSFLESALSWIFSFLTTNKNGSQNVSSKETIGVPDI